MQTPTANEGCDIERIEKTIRHMGERLRGYALAVEPWSDMMKDFLVHEATVLDACAAILSKILRAREDGRDAETTGVFERRHGSTGEYRAIDSGVGPRNSDGDGG